MTNEKDAAQLLRAIRTKLNLSQEQLADRVGVSFATVNRWEGGSNAPQKAAREVIAALAREAGIDDPDGATASTGTAAAGVTRRRRGKAAPDASSTKPMEQMLWDAACSIRGEKDAAKFKDYLLPLLFLKRLSDVFDDEIDRLAEEYGDRDTALEIAETDHSLLRFYLPPEARWAAISGRTAVEWPPDEKPKDIGEHLTKAVRAVAKQNPSLSGVIDVVEFAAERNGERDVNPAKLRSVVETFSDPRYRLGLADVAPDFLGRAYEYLLRKFAEGSGQSAGEFFTPTEVGLLMAHIMRPKPGEECHDYACGSAGLLVKLQLVARELDPTSRVPLRLTSQELQAESYAVAQMNGIIHDMQIEVARGDTMINPKFRTADGKIRTHDIVVANPMWNQPFAPDVFANDPFDRFRTTGGVTTGKGDWAWLQHTLSCMNDHGRAAVVLDSGAVTRGSGSKNEDKERNIRKWFVDHDLIDGVILLPDDLFYNTNAAGVIVVLNKRKPVARRDKIVLVNASQRVKKGRPKNYVPEDSVRPLAAMFLKGDPIDGEVAVITRDQLEAADYNLSPSRWVAKNDPAEVGEIGSLLREITLLDREAQALSDSLATLLAPVSGELLETRSHRDEVQKESDVGPVPTSWFVEPLERHFSVGSGGTPTRGIAEYWSGGSIPWVKTTEIDYGVITATQEHITRAGLESSAARLYPAGTLLMAMYGQGATRGRVALLSIEAACNQACAAINPTDGTIDIKYLFFFLTWRYDEIRRLAHGGQQQNLNMDIVRALPVAYPQASDEQGVIVAVLSAIDKKIALHKRKKAVLEDLFKALLQKLMTGEIRVADLDLSALQTPTADGARA